MSFIFLPNAYQNILPFVFFFHITVLLWYLLLCFLILLPWLKFMSFPIWSTWKRHAHRNVELAMWAISLWGCDTHPMKNHICVLFMDLTWHTTAHSSTLLGMSSGLLLQHQACSLNLSFLLPNIKLSQKMIITFCLIEGQSVQAECGWRAVQSRIHFHVTVSLGSPLKHPSQLSTHSSIKLLLQRLIVHWVENWELHPWKCSGRCPATNGNNGGRRTVLRD